MEYCIGLDLHQQYSVLVVKERLGRLVQRGKVPNDAEALRAFLAPLHGGTITVAVEATSNYYWMYETLEALGCTVKLAHPLKVRAIASARIKTDQIDAGVLCDLLRGDLLPTSYIPPAAIRELRELLRHRVRLVHDRTLGKNRLQAILTKLNHRVPCTDVFGKTGRAWLSTVALPAVFALQRDQLLAQIDHLTALVQQLDGRIRTLATTLPEARRLMAIPGLGAFSSLLIVAEVGEIRRFPSPKQLVSYAGLAPGVYASGQTHHGRGITRQGSRYLRWILCEAIKHLVRTPGPLQLTYQELRRAKGHGKATVACARKLLVGIFYVLRDGVPFAPVCRRPLLVMSR